MKRRAEKQRESASRAHVVEELLLVPRARRMLRRGDDRRAMLILREAACRAAGDARIWTVYGVLCARLGKSEEAEQALRQALWLRRRARDERRMLVMERLIEQLRQGSRVLRLRAA